jgi:hypothetical protein
MKLPAAQLAAMKAWGALQKKPDAPLRALNIESASMPDLCKVCTAQGGSRYPACAYALCRADINASSVVAKPKLFDFTDDGALGTTAPGNICDWCRTNGGVPCSMVLCATPTSTQTQFLDPFDVIRLRKEAVVARDFADLLEAAGKISPRERDLFKIEATKDFYRYQPLSKKGGSVSGGRRGGVGDGG